MHVEPVGREDRLLAELLKRIVNVALGTGVDPRSLGLHRRRVKFQVLIALILLEVERLERFRNSFCLCACFIILFRRGFSLFGLRFHSFFFFGGTKERFWLGRRF